MIAEISYTYLGHPRPRLHELKQSWTRFETSCELHLTCLVLTCWVKSNYAPPAIPAQSTTRRSCTAPASPLIPSIRAALELRLVRAAILVAQATTRHRQQGTTTPKLGPDRAHMTLVALCLPLEGRGVWPMTEPAPRQSGMACRGTLNRARH